MCGRWWINVRKAVIMEVVVEILWRNIAPLIIKGHLILSYYKEICSNMQQKNFNFYLLVYSYSGETIWM